MTRRLSIKIKKLAMTVIALAGISLGQSALAQEIIVGSGDRVKVFSMDGSELRTIGSAADGLQIPSGLLRHDRWLYVASFDNCRVLRYDYATGDLDPSFAASTYDRVSHAAHSPYALKMGPDGKLWALTRRCLLKIDPNNGAVLGRVIADDFDFARDMEFGPDGKLYVVDLGGPVITPWAGKVRRCNITTGQVEGNVDFTGGTGDGHRITSVTFGSNGHIFASDPYSDRISEFTREGSFIRTFAVGGGPGFSDGPKQLQFAPDGTLYAVAGDPNELKRYQGLNGSSPGQFIETAIRFSDGAWSMLIEDAVAGPRLQSISVNPASALPGQQVTLRCNLSGPASGATPIALTSSDPAAANLPANVTVPAGAQVAEVRFTVASVPPRTVSLSARLGADQLEETLNVIGFIDRIELAAGTVEGGTATSGVVHLNGPAPSGGLPVALKSASTAVRVPASITIAAGQTSGAFAIQTNRVTATGTADLTASARGSSASTHITLTPGKPRLRLLRLEPTTVKGGRSSVGRIRLTFAAPSDMTLSITSSDPALTPGLPRSITVPAGRGEVTFPISTVAVGSTKTVRIIVTGAGSRSATLRLIK